MGYFALNEATDWSVMPVPLGLVLVKETRYFDFFFSAFFSVIDNLPAVAAVAEPVVNFLQTVLPFFFAHVSTFTATVPGPLTVTESFFAFPLAPLTFGAGKRTGSGSCAGVERLNEAVAGVTSTWPVGSVPRTLSVCVPAANPVMVCGELQAAYPPPSRLHSKLVAVVLSKANVAVDTGLVSSGLEVKVVSGGIAQAELTV
jgi:hypothetical protein